MNKKRIKISLNFKKAVVGLIFSLPFLIGFMLFYLTPLIRSLYFSFFSVGTSVEGMVLTPTGLTNFGYVLTIDPYFIRTILGTLQSLSTSMPTIVLYSFFIAIVLNQKFKGRIIARLVFFLPIVINSGVIQMNLNDMFSQGISQQISGSGVENNVDTLDLTGAILSLLPYENVAIVDLIASIVSQISNITMNSGVQILIFIAGLQTISPSLYEASSIEGANGWENFWKITLPVMSPLILVNVAYTVIDQMTRPSNPVIAYIRSLAFYGASFGLASAMSWIYLPIVFIVLILVVLLIRRFTFYEN